MSFYIRVTTSIPSHFVQINFKVLYYYKRITNNVPLTVILNFLDIYDINLHDPDLFSGLCTYIYIGTKCKSCKNYVFYYKKKLL